MKIKKGPDRPIPKNGSITATKPICKSRRVDEKDDNSRKTENLMEDAMFWWDKLSLLYASRRHRFYASSVI